MFEWIDLAGAGSALAYLIEVTGKSVIVLIFAGLLVVAYRRSSAADRHRIWFAALFGVILFPVLSVALPSWNVLHNPGWLDDLRTANLEMDAPRMETDLPPIPSRARTVRPATGDLIAGMESLSGEQAARTAGNVEEHPSSTTPADASSSTPVQPYVPSDPFAGTNIVRSPVIGSVSAFVNGIRSMHWTTALLWIWLAGAIVVLTHLLIGAIGVLRLARRSVRLDTAEWSDLADEIGDRLFLKREVMLLRSAHSAMPMTWGGFNPVVLLPSDADSWSDDRKRCVLTHEFAHIKRWDCATQGVAQLACAIYWFNPLVWMAARHLRIEREKACDDYVISGGTQASEYAGHLLEFARSLKSSLLPPLGAVSMARPSQLEGRVLSILDPAPRKHRFSTAAKVLVTVLAVGIVIPLAAMAPAGDDVSPDEISVAIENIKRGTASRTTQPAKTPATTTRSQPNTSVAAADTTDDERRRLRLIAAFKKALKDSDAEIRANAAHVLGDIGDEDVIDALEEALTTDTDAEVRERAAWALGEIENDRGVPGLIRAMDDSDPGVRQQAIWALGEIESPNAAEALIEQLSSEMNDDVREMLVWAIGNLEDERAVDALVATYDATSDAEIRHKVVWALTEIESPRALPLLRRAVHDEDEEVRQSALWALGEFEDAESVPVFLDALEDPSAEVRQRAVWALAELESVSAIDALMQAAGDSDAEVRRMAVWALGELENPRALGVLTGAVDDDDAEVRRAAVYALGELEDDGAVSPLVRALGSSDAETRRTAAWALGEIESPRAVDALIAAYDDDDPEVRNKALWALSEIEDERAVDVFIQATRDADVDTRRMALHALDEFHSTEIEAVLIEAMSDQVDDVRRAAVNALSEYESERAETVLIRALESDSSVDVRRRAAYALGDIGTDRAIDALERGLEDADPEVRKAVMRALGSVDLSSDASSGRIRLDLDVDGDTDVEYGVDPGAFGVTMAEFGGQIARATLTALSDVGNDLLSSDVGLMVSDATNEALDSVDWNDINDEIQTSLKEASNEIDDEIVESLIEVVNEHPRSGAARRAMESLRRSDHPRARKFVQNIDG